MTKVLHIIKSLGRGGAETLLVSTIRRHSKSIDFTIIYFLPWKNQMVSELEAAGAKVLCFEARSNLSMLTKIPSIRKLIKSEKFDILHAHLPWSGFIARILRMFSNVALVYTEHNKLERYHFLTRLVNKVSLNLDDITLAVSKEVADSIRKHKGPDFKVKTVVNGVDTDVYSLSNYSKDEKKRELGLASEHIVISNVCVFRRQKRLDWWLSAAQRIVDQFPESRFLLVGDGPLKNEVIKMINDLSLQDFVIMPGLQSDVRPFLAASDIYLMSSEFEGLPIAMLEAMAMSLPVVSTNAGGIGEVLVHQVSGLVVPVSSPDLLYDQLRDLMVDSNKRTRIGDAARTRVIDSYSITKMVEQLEYVYAELLVQREFK